MSATESRESPQAENRRSRFSGFHARTYEMELLVSGAVVFGLIHLPPIIERISISFLAGLEGNVRLMGVLGQVYLQLVLYGLIAVFVLHLAMRGFWIGLLGLESVFPEGIRWDRLKLGPAMIKRYRAGIGSLAATIEKVDDLCSLIFSFGFLVIFIWIYFVILLVAAGAFAVGFSWLFLGGRGTATVFWIIAGLIVGIPVMAELIDKILGPRVRPGGAGERIIGQMVRIHYAVAPLRFIGATQLTLSSCSSPTTPAATTVYWPRLAPTCKPSARMGSMPGRARSSETFRCRRRPHAWARCSLSLLTVRVCKACTSTSRSSKDQVSRVSWPFCPSMDSNPAATNW